MSCPFCADGNDPTDSLESLLRACTMKYGHIQLFHDADGWQASVYHYEPKHLTHDGKALDDPVQALRFALIEDERRTRDVTRKYARAVSEKQSKAAAKAVLPEGETDDDFEGMF